ncbi:CD1871A family CXXC motif-containing protein [Faecalibacillus intestinalis]|nr:CD1871A family CXXC motif-containing protein [Faecalibacillus intestinalis]
MTVTYYGYSHGATRVELEKAIRICLECVGIG